MMDRPCRDGWVCAMVGMIQHNAKIEGGKKISTIQRDGRTDIEVEGTGRYKK